MTSREIYKRSTQMPRHLFIIYGNCCVSSSSSSGRAALILSDGEFQPFLEAL